MYKPVRQLLWAVLTAVLLLAVPLGAEARPTVDKHFPEHKAKNVPVNVIVTIEFSEKMDPKTVIDGITMRDEDSRDVKGKVSYSGGSYKATFKPDQPLKRDARYWVRISSSIKSEERDERLQAETFNFTTVPDIQMVVNGDQVPEKGITVNTSPVDIVVKALGADKVLYGKDELYNSGGWHSLDGVVLKPGNNNFSFKIIYEYEDEKGNTKEESSSFSRSVFLVNSLDEGSQVTHDLLKNKKVSVFDKKLEMQFPKDFYLRYGSKAAPDQEIVIRAEKTYLVSGSPAVSYLFNISPVRDGFGNYKAGGFGDIITYIDVPPGGVMTLPVDGDLTEAGLKTLTVFYDPQDGVPGNWRNLGGQADAKKKTVTVPFHGFGRYAAVNRIWNFADQINWPVREKAELLWARGILAPSEKAGPGFFGLTNQQGQALPISRGEFVVMLAKGLGLKLPEGNISLGIFSDISFLSNYSFAYNQAGNLVPLPADDARYIEAAAKNGIVSGMPDKGGGLVFRYYNVITREQAAVIVANAAGLRLTGTGEASRDKLASLFTDAASVSVGARPYVAEVVNSGLMQGNANGSFRPQAPLTGLEAAEIVYKLMEKKKLL